MSKRFQAISELKIGERTVAYRLFDRSEDELFDFSISDAQVLISKGEVSGVETTYAEQCEDRGNHYVTSKEIESGYIKQGVLGVSPYKLTLNGIKQNIRILGTEGWTFNVTDDTDLSKCTVISGKHKSYEIQFDLSYLDTGNIKDIVRIWFKNTKVETPRHLSTEAIRENLHKCNECKCLSETIFKRMFTAICPSCKERLEENDAVH